MPAPDLALQARVALDLATRHEREAANLQAMIDYGRSIGMPAGPGIHGDLQACIQCAAMERQRAASLKAEADALAAEMTGRQFDAFAKSATAGEIMAALAAGRAPFEFDRMLAEALLAGAAE